MELIIRTKVSHFYTIRLVRNHPGNGPYSSVADSFWVTRILQNYQPFRILDLLNTLANMSKDSRLSSQNLSDSLIIEETITIFCASTQVAEQHLPCTKGIDTENSIASTSEIVQQKLYVPSSVLTLKVFQLKSTTKFNRPSFNSRKLLFSWPEKDATIPLSHKIWMSKWMGWNESAQAKPSYWSVYVTISMSLKFLDPYRFRTNFSFRYWYGIVFSAAPRAST